MDLPKNKILMSFVAKLELAKENLHNANYTLINFLNFWKKKKYVEN